MKKAGGDLHPAFSLTDSVTLVCDVLETLIFDKSTYEILDEIGISKEEYEVARKELDIIADILCFEALELDP